MKKICSILIALVALVALPTFAQNHYEANIAVGGKAGVSFSKLMFNPTVPQGMQQGFVLGGSFRYIEEKNFGLIAEINLEQRGWKEDYEDLPFNYSRTFTYIQIPLLTHIYFGNEHLKGFFNLGPEFGYMIGKSIKSNFDYAHYETVEDYPNVNRYNSQLNMAVKNRFDYGISLGAGMEWRKDQKHAFNLEARAYYGLGNVFASHKTDVFSGSNSMAFTITLGYFYRLK